jgi:hypothetical protein
MAQTLESFIDHLSRHLPRGVKFDDLSDADREMVVRSHREGNTPWMTAMQLDSVVSEETDDDRMVATTEGW